MSRRAASHEGRTLSPTMGAARAFIIPLLLAPILQIILHRIIPQNLRCDTTCDTNNASLMPANATSHPDNGKQFNVTSLAVSTLLIAAFSAYRYYNDRKSVNPPLNLMRDADNEPNLTLSKRKLVFFAVFFGLNCYYCEKIYYEMGKEAADNHLLPGDEIPLFNALNKSAGMNGMLFNILLNQWYLYSILFKTNQSKEDVNFSQMSWAPLLLAFLSSLPFVFLASDPYAPQHTNGSHIPANTTCHEDNAKKGGFFLSWICGGLIYTILNLPSCQTAMKSASQLWQYIINPNHPRSVQADKDKESWLTWIVLLAAGPIMALISLLNAYFTARVLPIITKKLLSPLSMLLNLGEVSCNSLPAHTVASLFFLPFTYLVCNAICGILKDIKKSLLNLRSTTSSFMINNTKYCAFNALVCTIKCSLFFIAYASAGTALDLLDELEFHQPSITYITLYVTAMFNGSGAGQFIDELAKYLCKKWFPDLAHQKYQEATNESETASLFNRSFASYGTSETSVPLNNFTTQ